MQSEILWHAVSHRGRRSGGVYHPVFASGAARRTLDLQADRGSEYQTSRIRGGAGAMLRSSLTKAYFSISKTYTGVAFFSRLGKSRFARLTFFSVLSWSYH